MLLALVTLTPFLGAVLPLLAIRYGRDFCAFAAGCVTLAALLMLLYQAPKVVAGEVVAWSVPWLTSAW